VNVEKRLERELRQAVADVGAAADAWQSIERRLEHQQRRNRVSRAGVIVVALSLSTASVFGLWLVFRSAAPDRSPHEPGQTVERTPVELDPRVTATIPVGAFPMDVAVGERGVWASVPAQGLGEEDFVVHVDPATNEPTKSLPRSLTWVGPSW
jgi:hypothetical protein